MSQMLNNLNQTHHLHLVVSDLCSRVAALENGPAPASAPAPAPSTAAPSVTQSDLRTLEARLLEQVMASINGDVRTAVGKESALMEAKVDQMVGRLVRARVEQVAASLRDELGQRLDDVLASAASAAGPGGSVIDASSAATVAAGIEIDLSDMELTTSSSASKRSARSKKPTASLTA
jgi:hypothetical protein